jgi:long-chain acyl-CoA synthetase
MGRDDVVVTLGQGSPQSGDKNALSPIYRNVAAKDGWPKLAGVTTLYELFEKSVNAYPTNKCLGWRPITDGKAGDYVWINYKQTQEKAATVSAAIRATGTKAGGKVGIYSANCPEWMLVIQACNRTSLIIVPLYDSLGESAVEYTVNHSETTIVFIESSKFAPLSKAIPSIKKNVKTVVYWGKATESDISGVKSEGVDVYSWDEFLKLGTSKPVEPVPPKSDSPATIMYTSGTTGNPKGVVLTHANVLATVLGMQTYVKESKLRYEAGEDNMLSYLTLAHIFGRVAEEFALSMGAHIGYWQGDVKKLTDDVAALKPSLFVAVPRVLERIQSGITAKLQQKSWLVRFVFNVAFKFKLWSINRGNAVDKAAPLLDSILFKTFKQAFGGRVRFIVSGGAPLATHVEKFLAVTLCAPVFQGYGLTETCGASFIALPRSGHSGTVGPPTASFELRFEGSEELGYDPLADPPRGEILVRGPQVFAGYYKDDEKTKESIDKDGWFHTGDVGELTHDGCLKVIDRIKNMFKLAQGEYIAVEKLESAYSETGIVEQIWVYGNSYESYLLAVVVPKERDLKSWASSAGVSGSFEEICKDPKAEKYICEEINKTGKKHNLRGFERIKAVILDTEQFTVENGLQTPSFKLKRPQLQKHYQKQIDKKYADIKKGS